MDKPVACDEMAIEKENVDAIIPKGTENNEIGIKKMSKKHKCIMRLVIGDNSILSRSKRSRISISSDDNE